MKLGYKWCMYIYWIWADEFGATGANGWGIGGTGKTGVGTG